MDCHSNLARLFRAVEKAKLYGFDTPTNTNYKMTKLTVTLSNGVFIPYGNESYDIALSLRSGQNYQITIKNDRNGKLLNKYFAMIDLVWDNFTDSQQALYKGNRESFRHMVEFLSGCVETVYDPKTNEMKEVRRSISYDSMSEKEFQEFFSRAKDVILNTYLRKCKDQEYKDYILSF